MKKLKICFATEDFYPSFIGGQGVYGRKLVEELAKNGHKVTVLAEKRKGRRNFWKGRVNVNLILVPYCFGNQLILAFLEYVCFMLLCRNRYFDIVHANQLSGLFFVLFKPKNVGKVVVSIHNTNYDMAKMTESRIKWLLYQPLIFLERIMCLRADGLLFNSPNEGKDLLNYYNIKDKPTKIIYLGVDAPSFTIQEQQKARLKIRKELNVSVDTKIVLYVGRLAKRKRVDIVLKSLALLDNRSIFGVIIGKGADRQRLEKMAPDNVCFLGFVDDLRPYFLSADLFVTVSEAEGGFLLSALEAASFGLPLILSPSAAGFPIVKEGINGFIIDPDDYKGLSRKIIQVLKNSHTMGLKSKRIVGKFTWDKCARETLDFYSNLL